VNVVGELETKNNSAAALRGSLASARTKRINALLARLRLHHRLRGSGSTVVINDILLFISMVVTMTSKVNGKMEILTPVDLKPLKILKPKLDRMIRFLWAPSTQPIFVETDPRWSAPHIAEI